MHQPCTATTCLAELRNDGQIWDQSPKDGRCARCHHADLVDDAERLAASLDGVSDSLWAIAAELCKAIDDDGPGFTERQWKRGERGERTLDAVVASIRAAAPVPLPMSREEAKRLVDDTTNGGRAA